jgi:hypothetical protein
MTEYCRKKGGTVIYVKTAALMGRGDMEECGPPSFLKIKENQTVNTSPPLMVVEKPNEVIVPVVVDEVVEIDPLIQDRIAKIKRAIPLIPSSDYTEEAYNRPAAPKVSSMSRIVGFNVTRAEILEAMES